MPKTRIIKKYQNRRLYDTHLRTYITLEDIKHLVIERVEFQVIDAKTKKDLTQNTLLQIIMEQEIKTTPIFTTAMLQDFIRFSQEQSQSLFSEYLEQMLRLFIQQKDFLSHQWQTSKKMFVHSSPLQEFFSTKDEKKTARKNKNPK